MKKKNVLVIFGGMSNEYEVSLKSAAAAIENMDLSKYNLMMLGITQEGKWLRFFGDVEMIRNHTWLTDKSCVEAFISPSREQKGLIELSREGYKVTEVDVVFPILHGKFGEDGTIQGLLELSGIPFVGCRTLASAICMDKAITHRLVAKEGIKVARSIVLYKEDRNAEQRLEEVDIKLPVYIKPAKSGSSIGITKVFHFEQLEDAISKAFLEDDKVVIEENINGFEVGCAILGNENPMIGEVDEIELMGDFFDFNEKYMLANSKIHMPARVEKEVAHQIKKTAIKIYEILSCTGLARVDMFLTQGNEIYFNEVNTLPGFTSSSRYPKMMSSIGLSYTDVITRLIELALEEV